MLVSSKDHVSMELRVTRDYFSYYLDFHLYLVPSTDQSCFNTVITLTCNHPDVNAPEFLDYSPNWTEDGRIFTPTGSVFSSKVISPTTSVLNVSISPTHFQHRGHVYTCFLRTLAGRIPSNSVTVDPLSKLLNTQ